MLPIAPSSIRFSRHAAERYAERARAGTITTDQAGVELERIARHGTVQADPPPWVTGHDHQDLWLIIGDVAFPIERGSVTINAVTCITRGLMGPRTRHARTQAHRARRRHRAARRNLRGGRPHPNAPTVGEYA